MFTKCFLMNFHRILDVCNSFFIHNHSWNDSRLVSNHSQLYGYSIPVAHRPMAQEFIEFWFFSGYLKNSSHPQYQHLVIFRRILLGLLDTICNFDFMIVVNKTQSFFFKKANRQISRNITKCFIKVQKYNWNCMHMKQRRP